MAEAAHRRVAAKLRSAIEAGVYGPGEALPTVEELATAHGVSKQTAHQAVQALETEGLVRIARSQGSYVRERPRERVTVRDRTVYRDELGYYFDHNAKGWRPVGTPVRSLGVPPAHIAQLLGVPQGEDVIVRDRAMGPAGSPLPLQLTTSYLPMSLATEIPAISAENTGKGGIYDRIEERYGPIAWEETVSARLPTDTEMKALGIPLTIPVLVVTRVAHAVRSDGQVIPVEVNETRMAAERFAVSYKIQRDASAEWPQGGHSD